MQVEQVGFGGGAAAAVRRRSVRVARAVKLQRGACPYLRTMYGGGPRVSVGFQTHDRIFLRRLGQDGKRRSRSPLLSELEVSLASERESLRSQARADASPHPRRNVLDASATIFVPNVASGQRS